MRSNCIKRVSLILFKKDRFLHIKSNQRTSQAHKKIVNLRRLSIQHKLIYSMLGYSQEKERKSRPEFLLYITDELQNTKRMLSAWGNHPSRDSLRPISPLCWGAQTPIATSQVVIYQSISHGGNRQCKLVHTINCMDN